jgi:hypothetical protein
VALGRQLETMLPNIKFHYVAHAGHQVQNDQPQLVAKLMMDFLAATEFASSSPTKISPSPLFQKMG